MGGGTFGAPPQAPLRGIPPQTPIFASRLSSDTGRFNPGSLRSLIVVFCFAWGYVWGATPSPAEGDSPSDSHLRFAVIIRCRAFQSGVASLPDCRFFMLRMGDYVWGAAPSPAEEDSPSDSHLRFAVIIRYRAFQSRIASLPDCRFFYASHGGLRWAAAQTCLGISSPNPIFASRRFERG